MKFTVIPVCLMISAFFLPNKALGLDTSELEALSEQQRYELPQRGKVAWNSLKKHGSKVYLALITLKGFKDECKRLDPKRLIKRMDKESCEILDGYKDEDDTIRLIAKAVSTTEEIFSSYNFPFLSITFVLERAFLYHIGTLKLEIDNKTSLSVTTDKELLLYFDRQNAVFSSASILQHPLVKKNDKKIISDIRLK